MSTAKISTQRASIPRASLWMLLGIWAGIQLFFGFAVAPAALRLVPSPQAGELVATVLAAVNWSGVICGIALAAVALRLARGRFATWFPVALAAACVVSQLVVTPAVGRVRLSDPENAAKPEAALQFRKLHGVSMGLYGFTLAGVFVLAGWHGWCERRKGDSPPS